MCSIILNAGLAILLSVLIVLLASIYRNVPNLYATIILFSVILFSLFTVNHWLGRGK